jgi:hypothetical protein
MQTGDLSSQLLACPFLTPPQQHTCPSLCPDDTFDKHLLLMSIVMRDMLLKRFSLQYSPKQGTL